MHHERLAAGRRSKGVAARRVAPSLFAVGAVAAAVGAASIAGCPGVDPSEVAAGGGGTRAQATVTTGTRDISSSTGDVSVSNSTATTTATGVVDGGMGGTVDVSVVAVGVGGQGGAGGRSGMGGEGGADVGGANGVGGAGGAQGSGGALGMGGGIVACSDPMVPCNGKCVDTSSDVTNCGVCGFTCLGGPTVHRAVCSAGHCTPLCQPGFVDVVHPANTTGSTDDGCETVARRVFVTSNTLPLSFGQDASTGGGVPAANLACKAAAASRTLGGNWKAWLSDSMNGSPSQNFDRSFSGAFVLVDFQQIVWLTTDGLPTSVMKHALNMDENRNTVSNGRVWTGTKPDGTAVVGSNCSDWSLTSSTAVTIGSTATTDGGWTQLPNGGACNQNNNLYCFEQP